MPRIKLEGLTQPFESIKSGVQTGAAGITGAAAGITGAAKTSVQTLTGAATTGATAGFTGVFSLGRGFRDFILRGAFVLGAPTHTQSNCQLLLVSAPSSPTWLVLLLLLLQALWWSWQLQWSLVQPLRISFRLQPR